ncbi:hypothetical protein H5410_016874 [Solanum commersonii]|uniref:Uncharacterized protein n=1 Tax=Solanum commersonii TaxID=4109 RepID=A0A9J5ZYH6_SOLCO|nr:hypothetical protein H5410_016874 [Solanum commersonii]
MAPGSKIFPAFANAFTGDFVPSVYIGLQRLAVPSFHVNEVEGSSSQIILEFVFPFTWPLCYVALRKIKPTCRPCSGLSKPRHGKKLPQKRTQNSNSGMNIPRKDEEELKKLLRVIEEEHRWMNEEFLRLGR